jgi:hypothetical protein
MPSRDVASLPNWAGCPWADAVDEASPFPPSNAAPASHACPPRGVASHAVAISPRRPFGFGISPEPPIQVETIRAGIQFNPGASLGAGIDDRALVDRITFTFNQEPSRQVTVQPGILAGFG